MKKTVFTLLLVCIFLFTACGDENPALNGGNGAAAAVTRVVAAGAPLQEVPAAPQSGPLEGAVMLTDVDGMMGRAAAWTEDGMYQLASWGPESGANVTFFDYQTRTRSYLCGRDGCTHSDGSCPGWFSPEACAGGAGLFTDGESLYLLRIGSGVEAGKPETVTETSSSVITRMDFDGGGREVVMQLGSAEFIGGAVAKMQDTFYFLLDALAERDGVTTPLRRMVAYDTSTQAITPFVEFNLNTYFVGVCGQGFVMKSLEDRPDGTTLHTVFLYRVATGEREVVKQWSGWNVAAQVAGDNLYYADAHTAEFGVIDLDTKELSILSDTLPLNEGDVIRRRGIFDGRFSFWVEEQIEEFGVAEADFTKYYSVSLNDGSIIQNTLKFDFIGVTGPVSIIAENSTHFLVHYANNLVTVPTALEDGTPSELESQEELIGLISKEDYWNNNPNYLPIENQSNFLYR